MLASAIAVASELLSIPMPLIFVVARCIQISCKTLGWDSITVEKKGECGKVVCGTDRD